MSSDWWSKRLSSNTPPSTTARTSVPPTSPAIRFPTTQQPAQTPQSQATTSPNTEVTMGEAIRVWKGGEAMRKEGNMRCPDCGSQHVFTRVGSGTTVNGAQPAPRCFECGWNGKYSQADQSNWAI